MSIFDKYPETDFENFNLDWVIRRIKEITKEVSDFVVINCITWGGLHDPNKEYPRWCIVDTPAHEGYISIKPVPIGVTITNEDYWRQVANYSALYADFQNRIINCENNIISLDERASDLEDINYLHGKNILIIGDSISDEVLYPDCWISNFRALCASAGATVTNHSLQGRTIGVYTGATNTLVNALGTVPAGSYDHIIVFLGTNDWLNQTPMGSIGDNNVNSICNNITQFDTWKRTNYPNAEVTFITPLKAKVTSDIRHRLMQFYVKTIVSCALFHSYQIIDAHYFAPLLQINHIADWTFDGIHPITAYSPFLARFIFDNLMSEVSSIGVDAINTELAIGDVGGSADHVFADYSGGNIRYRVKNFTASATGLLKLADLPEECQSKNPIYGVANYNVSSTTNLIMLLSTGTALYAYIPTALSTGGVITGDTNDGHVKFGLNVVNGSL